MSCPRCTDRLKLVAVAAVLAVPLLCATAPLWATLSEQDLMDATVALRSSNGSGGSGVVLRHGVVLTAHHVSQVMATAVAEYQGRTYIVWQPVEFGIPKLDLGVVLVPSLRKHDGLQPCRRGPRVGEPIWIVGFNSNFHGPTLAKGVVINAHGIEGWPFFMHTAPLVQGFSGGPVWSVEGQCVLGINVGLYQVNESGYAFSFAIPVTALPRVKGVTS